MTRARSRKIAESAFSVFETDVFELAEDPESFGLTPEDRDRYAALDRAIDREAMRLILPVDRERCDLVASLLLDLANLYDEIAEDRDSDPLTRSHARIARKSLSTLWKAVLAQERALSFLAP